MNDPEFESAPLPDARPKTTTVVGLLILAAAIMSYLATYAMANALVAAEVLKPWPAGNDPRPKWFVVGFVILITLFSAIAGVARHLSAAQLRRIDSMDEGEG